MNASDTADTTGGLPKEGDSLLHVAHKRSTVTEPEDTIEENSKIPRNQNKDK